MILHPHATIPNDATTQFSPMLLALIGLDDGGDDVDVEPQLRSAAERSLALVDDLQRSLSDGDHKRWVIALESCLPSLNSIDLSDAIPSTTSILQPLDRHIVATSQFTVATPGFTSKSDHLWNAQLIEEL